MKTTLLRWISLAVLACSGASGQTYTNYVRQWQMPSGVSWDASDTVAASGTQESNLAINPGGARFDLWTFKSQSSTITEYLLDSSYVGTYVPIAQIVVDTEDPWGKDLTATGPIPVNSPGKIRRTRQDRPFTVYVTVSGLLNGATDPVASKSVNLLRHWQSYGPGGVGIGIDRAQATLKSSTSVNTNGLQILTFPSTSIVSTPLDKLRGEERFSVFSIADYQAPASQLASQFIQIWPLADGSIAGITQNQVIRYAMPALTLTYNDVYPDSRTYVQAYRGEQVLGTTGVVLPGSSRIATGSNPETHVLTPANYEYIFTNDGRWTLEIVTVTPFGSTRLAWVTFTLDRTIEVNGAFTTIE